jgi:hypothetical protein
MLRLDPFEAAALVKRVRTIARDARTHAKHLTAVLSGPGLGRADERCANPTAPLSVGDNQAENFPRVV